MGKLAPLLLLAVLFSSRCGGNSGVEGTWVVDKEATRQGLDAMGDGVPEELRAIYEEAIEGLEVELLLRDDGTFEIRGDTMGGPVSVKGSFEVDGERIRVSISEEDGNRRDPPKVVDGRIEAGSIRLRLVSAMPVDLVCRRR